MDMDWDSELLKEITVFIECYEVGRVKIAGSDALDVPAEATLTHRIRVFFMGFV